MQDNFPTSDEILAQLHRIESSTTFQRVPTLQDLLRLIVERTLSGRTDYLKGWHIAEALFDGQEADMRPAVGRLRDKLLAYYHSEGRTDQVQIFVPRGGYKATFSRGLLTLPAFEPACPESELPVSETAKEHDDRSSKFVLSIDGIVINSVGELLFRKVSDKTLSSCRSTYERALQDFAFAMVYGSELRAKWDRCDPESLAKNKREPAHFLIWELPEDLYQAEQMNPQFHSTRIFENENHRNCVRAYLRAMGKCMAEPRFLTWCRDWLTRESEQYMGKHSSLFQAVKHQSERRFGKSYYQDDLLQEIPALLGEAELATLITFVPARPLHAGKGDEYVEEARAQFVLENVLTHITTMYQFELHAEDSRLWRVPYALRADITLRHTKTRTQKLLRNLLVGHVMQFALQKISTSDTSVTLLDMLRTMRSIPMFVEIREMLEYLNLIVLAPGEDAEHKAARFIEEISRASQGGCSDSVDKFWLAHSSVLRGLDHTTPDDYKSRLYELFPELGPQRTGGRVFAKPRTISGPKKVRRQTLAA